MTGNEPHQNQPSNKPIGSKLGQTIPGRGKIYGERLPGQVTGGDEKERKGGIGQPRRPTRRHQKYNRRRIEKTYPFAAIVGKKPRRRLDADQGIVFLVLMGVDRIVPQGPGDAGDIKP